MQNEPYSTWVGVGADSARPNIVISITSVGMQENYKNWVNFPKI